MASVCKSVVLRRGCGSIKHIETKDLWIQEAIRRKSIEVKKIPRELNVADCLASYSNATNLWMHAEMMDSDVSAKILKVQEMLMTSRKSKVRKVESSALGLVSCVQECAVCPCSLYRWF